MTDDRDAGLAEHRDRERDFGRVLVGEAVAKSLVERHLLARLELSSPRRVSDAHRVKAGVEVRPVLRPAARDVPGPDPTQDFRVDDEAMRGQDVAGSKWSRCEGQLALNVVLHESEYVLAKVRVDVGLTHARPARTASRPSAAARCIVGVTWL